MRTGYSIKGIIERDKNGLKKVIGEGDSLFSRVALGTRGNEVGKRNKVIEKNRAFGGACIKSRVRQETPKPRECRKEGERQVSDREYASRRPEATEQKNGLVGG